jgi:ATP/maltotriose-dependent transcriptional regulator MalT
MAERLQAAGNIYFVEPRSLQLRLLAERGAYESAPASNELVGAARESGDAEICALAFAAAVRPLLAQGRPERARALLSELEQVAGTRTALDYASELPVLVRTTLALGDMELATRLLDGVEPRTPLSEHVLAACHAQLAEAAGEHAQAAALYAKAAGRWQEFGNVPERAYALLGRGRWLAALGSPDAVAPLREARGLFASTGYKPALAETEALLDEIEAAAV